MVVATVLSVVVGVAYLGIAACLGYAAYRNKKIPSRASYWVFALMLLSAGVNRILDPFGGPAAAAETVALSLAAVFGAAALCLSVVSMKTWLEARPPEELVEAHRRFRVLVENVRDYAIFLLDLEGNVVTWNVGAERIKGYKADEIVGQHFSTFYTQSDRDRNHPAWELEQARLEGRYEEEGWRVRKDGTTFWARVTITALRAPDGRLEGFAKVVRDLSERKEAETEAARLNQLLGERMMALEAFNHSVCHDLNAPLRAMEGFTAALVEDFGERAPPAMRDYIGRIRAASERMRNLVRDLLRLSQVNREALRADVTDFSLTDLAWEVVQQEKAYDEHSRHKVEIEPNMRAEGDQFLVRLLLQNLLSNAFKFSGRREGPVIRVGRRGNEFFVCDNGIGFEQEKAALLFKPFSRLHTAADYPGTGIGLTICKRVTDIHGGQIRAEGRPGEGACFFFTLGGTQETTS